jgi:hypothetical protein
MRSFPPQVWPYLFIYEIHESYVLPIHSVAVIKTRSAREMLQNPPLESPSKSPSRVHDAPHFRASRLSVLVIDLFSKTVAMRRMKRQIRPCGRY